MKRRDFLQTALKTGAYGSLASFLPLSSLAQSKVATGNLLIIHLSGGWDTSLSTDPWTLDQRPLETDYFLEYRKEDLIPFSSSFFGPALKPLQNYFDRMAAINGIFLSANDIGHDGCGVYMESGNGQGEKPSLATEVDHHFLHSPFGTATNSRVYTGRENRMIFDMAAVQNTKSIKVYETLVQYESAETDLMAGLLSLEKNRERIEIFNKKLATFKEQLTEADLIVATFLSGLSRSMVIRPSSQNNGNLDTHSQHENAHKNTLTELFGSVAQILKGLETTESATGGGRSLLDETTVMVFSEFCRTPALNASRGKDHNPQSNSVLLFGPGIKAGKVGAAKNIGRAISTRGAPYLVGQPLKKDETVAQNRSEAAFLIRPETVLATVVRSMGLDAEKISQGIAKAPVLKSLLR